MSPAGECHGCAGNSSGSVESIVIHQNSGVQREPASVIGGCLKFVCTTGIDVQKSLKFKIEIILLRSGCKGEIVHFTFKLCKRPIDLINVCKRPGRMFIIQTTYKSICAGNLTWST